MTQTVSIAASSMERRDEDEILDKMANQHIRVAVVGNVDAGKSTLIGSLVSNMLDDGRGAARAKITKFKHELISGRTSTIASHMLGLDENYEAIVSSSDSEIVKKSNTIVTLMDMAGHEKYLKTTIAGVSRGVADYALVLVNSAQPPTHMTTHHLTLCIAMGIPVIVVMTKADRCPADVFKDTKQRIQAILRDPKFDLTPFNIRSKEDVNTVKGKVAKMLLTPIVAVSSVTGEGMDILKALLGQLPQRRRLAKKQRKKDFEYLVEDVFQVPGVGTVLSGMVIRGEWKKGEPIFVGPMKDGSILEVVPKSVHVAQTNVDHVYAGHSVCFAIPKLAKDRRKKLFTKGMVALKKPFKAVRRFTTEMTLLKFTNVTIVENRFQAILNILNNKVTATVVAMKDMNGDPCSVARPGERVTMTFELPHKAAYVRKGMKVILRDGHVRGLGGIISIGDE